MGKKAPSAPPPPDPTASIAAQGTANREAAVSQAHINQVNQYTPYGSLEYSLRGNAPDGTPQYSATQTLAPGQQRLLDTQTGLAQRQLGQVGDALSQPFTLDNAAVEGRLMELGRQRLDPILQQRRTAADVDLLNRGFSVGSEGYSRAMGDVSQAENDAYTQLLLNGRQQSVSELLTQRTQPLNELAALVSGNPVQAPQYANTPQTQVNPADVLGAQQMAYQGQLAQFGADSQRSSAALGGMYGLGAAALGFGLNRAFPAPVR